MPSGPKSTPNNLACLHTRKNKMSLIWYNSFLVKSVSEMLLADHFASIQNKLEFVWRHIMVLMKNSYTLYYSSNNLECTHCSLAFLALLYRFECQFSSIFKKDCKQTELAVLLFFQFSHPFYKQYHDCQNNVAIFPCVV